MTIQCNTVKYFLYKRRGKSKSNCLVVELMYSKKDENNVGTEGYMSCYLRFFFSLSSSSHIVPYFYLRVSATKYYIDTIACVGGDEKS